MIAITTNSSISVKPERARACLTRSRFHKNALMISGHAQDVNQPWKSHASMDQYYQDWRIFNRVYITDSSAWVILAGIAEPAAQGLRVRINSMMRCSSPPPPRANCWWISLRPSSSRCEMVLERRVSLLCGIEGDAVEDDLMAVEGLAALSHGEAGLPGIDPEAGEPAGLGLETDDSQPRRLAARPA